MRKLVVMAALAVGLAIGSGANAAQVDLFLTQTAPSSWELTASTDGSTSLGAVNLLLTGLDSMVTNPANAGISALDSSLGVDAISDGVNFLVVNNVAGQAIAGPGSVKVLLATLGSPDANPVTLTDTSSFGGTDNGIFLSNGTPLLTGYTITVQPTVPEPTAMVLLGLGLAAFGMIRRSA